jgi:hypothetical protein
MKNCDICVDSRTITSTTSEGYRRNFETGLAEVATSGLLKKPDVSALLSEVEKSSDLVCLQTHVELFG